MSNFKSGSGNLDFGSDDETEDESNSEVDESELDSAEAESGPDSAGTKSESEPESAASSSATERSPAPANPDRSSDQPTGEQESAGESGGGSAKSRSSADEYPYFVRRNNVGDERETRLELHVRDKVADHEAEFRSELADHLGTNEIAKTDAREFALLAAFQDPERVAELMENEGFGALD